MFWLNMVYNTIRIHFEHNIWRIFEVSTYHVLPGGQFQIFG